MKRFTIALIATHLLLTSGGIALAQSTGPAPSNGAGKLGILQPNGVFVPLAAKMSAEDAAAANAKATVFTGKFDVTLNITVVSPIPATNKVVCGDAFVDVVGSSITPPIVQDSILQSVSGGAVAISGKNAVCHYVIYYLWSLLVPAQDTVTVSFGSASAMDVTGNTRSTNVFSNISLAVPKNGATTTLTASLGL